MDKSKWEYKKLGEVCAPKSDILRANKLFGNDDIIDYVDISSIDNTTHCITQPTSYVFKEAPSRAQQKVEQGDVLYSLVRPNLKNIAVVTSSDTDKYVASSGFCVLRGKDVETRYLYHMVLGDAFTNYILGLVSGANYPAVREDDVKGFSFRCPPLADQQRIVAELDCLNEMIALKQEQLKEFDKLAQSIFYDMFGDPISNEKGWDKNKLDELYKVTSSKRILQSEWQDNGVPFYKVADIVNLIDGKTVIPSTFIKESTYNELISLGLVPNSGDILITSRGTLGECYIVLEGDKFYFQDGMITWLSQKANNILPIYLKSVFGTKSFLDSLLHNANMSTVAYLSIGQLSKVLIPLPPLALQQQFAEKIQAIEVQKELVKKSIAETQQLLDSRMDYYFN